MTDTSESPYKYLYQSVENELDDTELEIVEGSIPDWISGTCYRNGPALFEIGSESFNHWFDGQAMIHAFRIKDGKVIYANKFIQSVNLKKHREAGKIAVKEFGTDPCHSVFQRFKGVLSGFEDYQNTNVSVKAIADKLCAMTEVPSVMVFNRDTLETEGPMRFSDEHQQGMVSTAHPQYFRDGTYCNITQYFGRENGYLVYTFPPDAKTGKNADGEIAIDRTLLAKVPRSSPSYMHSFQITENFVIIVEYPWFFSLGNMMVDTLKHVLRIKESDPMQMYQWLPEHGTKFTLIDAKTGEVDDTYAIDEAFFGYHGINAFEVDGGKQVVIDLMTYGEAGYSKFTLETLRKRQPKGLLKTPQVRRITIDRTTKHVSTQSVMDGTCELCTINDAYNTKEDYGYVYGIDGDHLVKADMRYMHDQNIERNHRTYAGKEGERLAFAEPLFVARPNAETVDDGALLSVVFDLTKRESFLMILDAKSLEEIGRAKVPHIIPQGIHGTFLNNVQ